MTYDDQWLFNQIKRLNERLSIIETRVGSINIDVNNLINTIVRYGTTTPTTPPVNPFVPNVNFNYIENIWSFWDINTQTWIEVDPQRGIGFFACDTINDLRLVPASANNRVAFIFSEDTVDNPQMTGIYRWDGDLVATESADNPLALIRPLDSAATDPGTWIKIL